MRLDRPWSPKKPTAGRSQWYDWWLPSGKYSNTWPRLPQSQRRPIHKKFRSLRVRSEPFRARLVYLVSSASRPKGRLTSPTAKGPGGSPRLMRRDGARPASTAFAREADLYLITGVEVLKTSVAIGECGNLGIIGNEKLRLGAILTIHLNCAGLSVLNGPKFTDTGIRQQETGKISHQRAGGRKDRPNDHQQYDLHGCEDTAAASAGKSITAFTLNSPC